MGYSTDWENKPTWYTDHPAKAGKRNLLEETKGVLEEHHLNITNIRWVGNDYYAIPVEEFVILADQEYSCLSNAHKCIPSDLKIVGDGWYLERCYRKDNKNTETWWMFRKVNPLPKQIANISIKAFVGSSTIFDAIRRTNSND